MSAVPHPSRNEIATTEATEALESAEGRRLYERYYRRVYVYCLGRLRTREEAEDALQSTFLYAFRALKRGVVPEYEAAWLIKIAENVCLARLRAAARRGRVESPRDLNAFQNVVAAPATSTVDITGIERALADLPENQRRAILLREWQGLSYREISERLGLSLAAVETLIFRARRSLARVLSGLSPLPYLRSLLQGGAAKVAATAVVVAGTSVAALPQVERVLRHEHAAPAPAQAAADGQTAATGTGTLLAGTAAPTRATSARLNRRGSRHLRSVGEPVQATARTHAPAGTAPPQSAPGAGKSDGVAQKTVEFSTPPSVLSAPVPVAVPKKVTAPTLVPPVVDPLTAPSVAVPPAEVPSATITPVTTPVGTTPGITTPSVTTPTVTAPGVTAPPITAPAITPQAIVPQAIVPQAITAPAITAPSITPQAMTTPAITTPVITTPAVTTPVIAAPAITTPAITAPAITTPVITTPVVPLP